MNRCIFLQLFASLVTGANHTGLATSVVLAASEESGDRDLIKKMEKLLNETVFSDGNNVILPILISFVIIRIRKYFDIFCQRRRRRKASSC